MLNWALGQAKHFRRVNNLYNYSMQFNRKFARKPYRQKTMKKITKQKFLRQASGPE